MLLEQTKPHDLLDAVEAESVLQSTPSARGYLGLLTFLCCVIV
jgi:hypothetical protein